MHERTQIRNALVAALTGTTPAVARVFKQRVEPIRPADVPAVHVYFDSENIDADDSDHVPRVLKRVGVFGVDGWLAVTEDLEDKLDEFAEAIEAAIDSAHVALNECSEDVILSSTELGISVQGDRKLGCVHLEYSVTYRTPRRVAFPTDKFNTAGFTTRIGSQDEVQVVTDINQENP